MAKKPIHVIGGGLAGCEAAWQAARAGAPVVLHEMRPHVRTDAHQTDGLAELVCSNSFRADDKDLNAVGLLHEEMRRAASLIMMAAENRSLERGLATSEQTENPPADCPKIPTRCGSPPNAVMFRCTHSSAAIWSSRP